MKPHGSEEECQRLGVRKRKICLVTALMSLVVASVPATERLSRAKKRYSLQNYTDRGASGEHIASSARSVESDEMKGQNTAGERRAQDVPPRVSGGPCEYKTYKGIATIISVRKKEMPKGYGGPSHESYEVKFSFHTDEEIEEAHGKVEGKEHLLLLTNSWYPGPRFLQKYGIVQGKSFNCHLKVITKGPCTPVVFDFPGINLSDYFESRR